MRYLLILCAFAAALGTAQADPFLVVPGRSIGQTHLGRNGDFYLKKLPPPTASDAAMSHESLVWVSETTHDTLFIRTVRNDVLDPPSSGVTINEIRVTSPRFHTRDGLHTGSRFKEIRRRFPNARLMNGSGTIYAVGTIYAIAKQGIVFEFARRPSAMTPCIAITVYPPGQSNFFADATQVLNLFVSVKNSVH